MRTLIIGDIHGCYKSLKRGLKKVGFDINQDRLICVGDYINGWADSVKVVDYLIEIQQNSPFENIYILGNHDYWFREVLNKDFLQFRDKSFIKSKYNTWIKKDGLRTYREYLKLSDEQIQRHKTHFFDILKEYYIEDNKLFVHAGFDPKKGFMETLNSDPKSLHWNRSLFEKAVSYSGHGTKKKKYNPDHKFDDFEKIYIGHTPTTNFDLKKPEQLCNVINVDQGCKNTGRLTIWIEEDGSFIQTKKISRLKQ